MGRWFVFLIIGVTTLTWIPGLDKAPGLYALQSWALFSAGFGLSRASDDKSMSGLIILALSLPGIMLHELPESQIVALFTIVSIAVFQHTNLRCLLPNSSRLTILGELSYSLYLIHVPIGVHLLLRARSGIWLEYLPLHIAYDITVLLACILSALVFHILVERPSINLSRTNALAPWARAKSDADLGRSGDHAELVSMCRMTV